MKERLWKIWIVLGMAAAVIMNGSSEFVITAAASTVPTGDTQPANIQGENKPEENLQSCQILGTVTKKKSNQFFFQIAEDGGFVLWKWKKQQSYLVGFRKYWDREGNLEESKVKVNVSGKKKQLLNYNLSCMEENAGGDLNLIFEKKNKQKAIYVTVQPNGSSGKISKMKTKDKEQNIEDSDKWKEIKLPFSERYENYKIDTVIVTKDQDIMYAVLSPMDESEGKENKLESYIVIKQELKQSEKTPVQKIQVDYKQYNSAQELVDEADWIFTGIVKNITYEQIDTRMGKDSDSSTGLNQPVFMPYTVFEIEVLEVHKGDIKEETVQIKRLGGIFDSMIYELEGASDIEDGNKYLFAVKTYANSYPSLLNPNQAAFNLDTEAEKTEHNGITSSQILAVIYNENGTGK